MSVRVAVTHQRVLKVSKNSKTTKIASSGKRVVVSAVGKSGPAGPAGELPLSWIIIASSIEYSGTTTNIASGTVYQGTYEGNTIYRHVASSNNAQGYPVEDAFYSDFDGTNLSNIIVSRS